MERRVQSHHRHVVGHLLAESVREASEAAHSHPHVEVLALDIERQDAHLYNFNVAFFLDLYWVFFHSLFKLDHYRKSGWRQVVTMAQVPEDEDDELRLIVDLPPGAVGGPIVSPRLAWWGLKRAAHYRALLGLAYRGNQGERITL